MGHKRLDQNGWREGGREGIDPAGREQRPMRPRCNAKAGTPARDNAFRAGVRSVRRQPGVVRRDPPTPPPPEAPMAQHEAHWKKMDEHYARGPDAEVAASGRVRRRSLKTKYG